MATPHATHRHVRNILVTLMSLATLLGRAPAQEPSLRATLGDGHRSMVLSIAFSPDGRSLASGGEDNQIKVWDLATGRVRTFLATTDHVVALAFSPDSKSLVSTRLGAETNERLSGEVALWNLATGKTTQWVSDRMRTTRRPITAIFSPDGKVLAWGGGSWDEKTRRFVSGYVALVSPSGGREGAALLDGHGMEVRSVAFSPDGKVLAAATGVWDDRARKCSAGQVKLWDIAGRKIVGTLDGHTDLVTSVAFGPDGKQLATASRDGTAKVWDVPVSKAVVTMKGHTGSLISVAFNPDGKSIATTAEDKTVRLWDVATGKEEALLRGPTDRVNAVAFSPDGKTLAAATQIVNEAGEKLNGTVLLWDVASRKPLESLQAYQLGPVAFSPDGKLLAAATAQPLGVRDPAVRGMVKLWDMETGKLTATLDGHAGAVSSVLFSPDGKLLASIAQARDEKTSVSVGEAKLWDLATGKTTATFALRGSKFNSVAFSPDSKTLAVGSEVRDPQKELPRVVTGEVKLVDVTTGKETATFKGENIGPVLSVAFSPDGATVAAGGADGSVRLWEVAGGKNVSTIREHTDAVSYLTFSPSGKTLASLSTNKIQMWDVPKGKNVGDLRGDWTTAGYSREGNWFALAGKDGVRLWGPGTDDMDFIVSVPARGTHSLAFTPDARILATSRNGIVQLWDLPSGKKPDR